MPDLKISQLPVASTPLAGTELVPIVQGGTTDQTTVQAILTSAVPSGTANGVLYLNGSKVVTSGSALTFDGTGLGIGTSSPLVKFDVKGTTDTHVGITASGIDEAIIVAYDDGGIRTPNLSYAAASHKFVINTTEQMRLDASGNLGLGVTPSAWSGGPVIQIGGASSAALFSDTNNTNLSTNAYYNGSWRYQTSTVATSRFQSSDGVFRWYTAPSGTAGNAISFTQALTLDVNRNLALNTTSVGTSAVGALSIGSGTEPSSGPADTVQLYSVDRSAGNTIPAFYCEGTGVTDAGITNTTVTHKIAMKINGTVYYLLATTNAT